MSINAKAQQVVESFFTSVLSKLKSERPDSTISDLYVQVDKESGELSIYDDEETLIEKKVIFDWVGSPLDEVEFYKQVVSVMNAILTALVSKEAFDSLIFSKPFSVSLTDEAFTVVEELLFLDNDMLRLDDPLLKDLDHELDDFLMNLLSDIK